MINYNENLIPLMTSNTTPSGEVIYSSYWDTWNSPPYKVFNHSTSTVGDGWFSKGIPAYIGYKFMDSVIINKYKISIGNCNDLNCAPSDFTFEGSNDNNNWVILDTRIGETPWVLNEIREYTFRNFVKYKYYRLKITKTIKNVIYGETFLAYVGELQMMPGLPNKYLLKQSNQYYTLKSEYYKDGKFTPITALDGKLLLTKEDYDIYGFNSESDLCTNMTVGTETFRPIDKFTGNISLRMFKYK